MSFETIVTNFTPAQWMDQVAKLRTQKNGPRPAIDQSRTALKEPK